MSHTVSINDKLYNELKEYCDLNKIKVSSFCEEMLKKALNEAKYGDIPFGVIEHKEPKTPVQPISVSSGSSISDIVEEKEEVPHFLSPLAEEYKKEMPKIDKEEAQKIIDMAINKANTENNKKPRKTRVLN